MPTDPPISLAFDLIRRYAEQHKWTPIGYREWRTGDWSITVNGTKTERDGVPPFHARVANERYIGRKDSARRLRIWSKHSPRPSLMPPTPDPGEVTR